MKALNARIPPPILATALGGIMWAVERPHTRADWQVVWAVICFVAAGVFGLPALGAFRRQRTTINPMDPAAATSLVTSGIYRFSRNPMYVSLVLFLVAWAIWLGGSWSWLGPIFLLTWLDRFQIRPEEAALEMRFGGSYRDYKSRVRRWI